MSIYEIFVFLFLIFAFVFSKDKNLVSKWAFCISVLTLVAIAALRDFEVGTDTMHYYYHFQHIDSFSVNERGESLFFLTEKLFSKLGWEIYMWFVYSIIIGVVSFVIYRISDNKYFSLFLYMTLGYYSQSFNVMRQFIAVAIVFVAFYYLSNNRNKKGIIWFVIMTIIASLYHKTALLGFLFIPILFIKIKDIWWYSVLGASFIIGVLFSSYLTYIFEPFYDLVEDNYAYYLEAANIDASRNLMSNLGLNIVGFSTLFLAPKKSEKKWTAYLLVLSVIFNNIFGWGYLVRISIFFGIAQIIAIPMVTMYIKNNIVKGLYFALIVLYCFARFYVVTLNSDGIMPYLLR